MLFTFALIFTLSKFDMDENKTFLSFSLSQNTEAGGRKYYWDKYTHSS